jgi:hypothetical protein
MQRRNPNDLATSLHFMQSLQSLRAKRVSGDEHPGCRTETETPYRQTVDRMFVEVFLLCD